MLVEMLTVSICGIRAQVTREYYEWTKHIANCPRRSATATGWNYGYFGNHENDCKCDKCEAWRKEETLRAAANAAHKALFA